MANARYNKDHADVPSKVACWGQTSFVEYEFTYRWSIDNYKDRRGYHSNIALESPQFSHENKKEKFILKILPIIYQRIGNTNYDFTSLQLRLTETEDPPRNLWVKYCFFVPSNQENSALSWESHSQVNFTDREFVTCNFTSSGTLNSDRYLVDGALTIYCRLKVRLLDTPSHKSGIAPKTPSQATSLGSSMNAARLKGQFTDTVLVCGEKEFKAHRVVLAMKSSFFNARFQSHWDSGENKIQMPDIAPATLESMLNFMYTGQCQISTANADSILSAAQEYGLEELRHACEVKLSSELNVGSVIGTLVSADTHSAENLKKACFDFFVAHSTELLASEEWKALEKGGQHDKLIMEVLKEFVKRKN